MIQLVSFSVVRLCFALNSATHHFRVEVLIIPSSQRSEKHNRSPELHLDVVSGKGTVPTWPEVKAIEPVGEEVITNAITTPLFTPAGVRGIPFGGGPAHSQVSGFCCHKRFSVVHHELIVPLLILRRPFTDAQENIRPHALDRKRQRKLLLVPLLMTLNSIPDSLECTCVIAIAVSLAGSRLIGDQPLDTSVTVFLDSAHWGGQYHPRC